MFKINRENVLRMENLEASIYLPSRNLTFDIKTYDCLHIVYPHESKYKKENFSHKSQYSNSNIHSRNSKNILVGLEYSSYFNLTHL
jgi:hypothetical protein